MERVRGGNFMTLIACDILPIVLDQNCGINKQLFINGSKGPGCMLCRKVSLF